MSAKPVWANPIEEAAWIETNCARCFQPDEATKRITGTGPGCPHLARAAQGRLPAAWTRRRNAVMGDTYRCADQLKKPPVNRRSTGPADTPPMLDVTPTDRNLIPVDGWPDWKAERRKGEVDHQ